MTAKLGSNFGQALCKHFGLDPKQVSEVDVRSHVNSIFGADLFIALTGDDIEAIGKIMKEQNEH